MTSKKCLFPVLWAINGFLCNPEKNMYRTSVCYFGVKLVFIGLIISPFTLYVLTRLWTCRIWQFLHLV